MSNLIEIKNASVNGEDEQVVDAKDLYERLEVKTRFAMWIKRRVEDAQLLEGHDFIIYHNFGKNSSIGRPNKEYALTLEAAKHISLMEKTDKGREIRDYFIRVEREARKMFSNNNGHPVSVSVWLEDFKRSAEILGLTGNQAILSASKATEKITGYNPLLLLGVDLASSQQSKLYTVSELAKLANIESGRKMNRLLEERGLQESYRDHKNRLNWKLSEKTVEKGYAIYLDTGKQHSDGSPVQQIKWYENVLTVLN